VGIAYDVGHDATGLLLDLRKDRVMGTIHTYIGTGIKQGLDGGWDRMGQG
jgi:hypothetical protein